MSQTEYLETKNESLPLNISATSAKTGTNFRHIFLRHQRIFDTSKLSSITFFFCSHPTFFLTLQCIYGKFFQQNKVSCKKSLKIG